jgi:hypothetical protein
MRHALFESLEQRKHLRVRAIGIPRIGQLATGTHVLVGSAEIARTIGRPESNSPAVGG